MNNKVRLTIFTQTIKSLLPRSSYRFSKNTHKTIKKKVMKEKIINNYDISLFDNYVFQGITTFNDLTLISLYDAKKESNSKIIILNNLKEIIHIATLYNNAHVGGITYVEEFKLLWVTDKKGCISAYKIDDILSLDYVEPYFKKVDVSSNLYNIYGNKAVAFISYHDSKIYVGNYNINKKSIIKEYKLKKDGNIDFSSVVEYSSPPFLQGICFYQDKYLITSSSFGINKSILRVYKYDKKIDDLNNLKCIICLMPPMMEQITIKDNKLLTLFESNAKKYKKIFTKGNDLIEFNIESIINYINMI